MADEIISYEEIRRVQALERDNKALQEIDPNFFKRVGEYIKTKEKLIEENKGKDNVFSQQIVEKNEHELKNVRRIIEDICSRRRRKIVMQALNNISAKVHNTENMLPEEEELYNSTIEIVRKYTDAFISKFSAPKEEVSEVNEEEKSLKKLKFMDAIPAFLWKDGTTYGPYEKEAVAGLPAELGEILIKEGKAIEVKESGENEDTKGNQ
ncbi:MAG: DNA replication complex GINS family protein [Nanoarchaeota archaeon]|nr:DNA replication complex GINS family protein [Nanoarchaeota archaeon]